MLSLVLASSAMANTVFSQTDNLWGEYTSQHNTSNAGSTYFPDGDTASVYDNFTLGSSASVALITWHGAYYDGPPQSLNPDGSYGYGPAAPGTVTGFTIRFYSDVIDPGTGLHRPNLEAGPIHTTTISGNANETDLGITDSETVYYGPNKMYSYSAALSTSFAATAGTQYWLSIVAESAFPPEWSWSTAGLNGYNTGLNGPYFDPAVSLSYRKDTSGGILKRNISGGDFTFSLVATDTTPPVIAAHDNITVTSAAAVAVTYTPPNATDDVDATAAASCTPASGSTFALGTTTVTCNKTDAAGNAAVPVTFTVTVNPPLSNNADLASLGLSSGTLSPAFNPSTIAYTASVDNIVEHVSVTTTTNPGASAVVGGGSHLFVGTNTVTIIVTAADGTTTRTYTVTVTRAAPAPTPLPPTDVCPNLGGVQSEVPNGYDLVDGQCVPKPPVVNAPVSAPGAPDQPGSAAVVIQPPPTGNGRPPPPVMVTTTWGPGAFTIPVTVLVTPQLPVSARPGSSAPTPTRLAGGFTVGSTTVQMTVTDASGAKVTSFQAPIVIHISASQAGDVPAFSQDGSSWIMIPQLDFPELPARQPDGYYPKADGSIDIYTRHATLFGLLKDTTAPTSPKLKVRVTKTNLRLSWRGAKDNVRVTGYVVSRNGHGYKATTRTVVVLPLKAAFYVVRARDAASNVSKPSTTVKVVRTTGNKKQPFTVMSPPMCCSRVWRGWWER